MKLLPVIYLNHVESSIQFAFPRITELWKLVSFLEKPNQSWTVLGRTRSAPSLDRAFYFPPGPRKSPYILQPAYPQAHVTVSII